MKNQPLIIISRLMIFLGVAIVFAVAILFSGCGKDPEPTDDPPKDKEREELIVGMSCDNPPYGWISEEKSDTSLAIAGKDTFAEGFDAAIANALAEEMDVKIKVKLYSRSDLIPAVEKGDVDLLISGVNPLESRAEQIAFSDPYFESEFVVIVKKDGAFANETAITGFANARLTAGNESYAYNELLPQIKNATIMPALTFQEDMRVALSNDVIDGYLTTLPRGMSGTRLHPEYAMITFGEGLGFEVEEEYATIAIGVNLEREELLDTVNEALATIGDEDRKLMMERAIYAEPEDLEETDPEEEAE